MTLSNSTEVGISTVHETVIARITHKEGPHGCSDLSVVNPGFPTDISCGLETPGDPKRHCSHRPRAYFRGVPPEVRFVTAQDYPFKDAGPAYDR